MQPPAGIVPPAPQRHRWEFGPHPPGSGSIGALCGPLSRADGHDRPKRPQGDSGANGEHLCPLRRSLNPLWVSLWVIPPRREAGSISHAAVCITVERKLVWVRLRLLAPAF